MTDRVPAGDTRQWYDISGRPLTPEQAAGRIILPAPPAMGAEATEVTTGERARFATAGPCAACGQGTFLLAPGPDGRAYCDDCLPCADHGRPYWDHDCPKPRVAVPGQQP